MEFYYEAKPSIKKPLHKASYFNLSLKPSLVIYFAIRLVGSGDEVKQTFSVVLLFTILST